MFMYITDIDIMGYMKIDDISDKDSICEISHFQFLSYFSFCLFDLLPPKLQRRGLVFKRKLVTMERE